MVLHALRQEILPADGVEFATSLKLTPQCFPAVSLRHEFVTRVLCNVVVARSNILRVFEVREEPAPVQADAEDERDRRSMVRRGTGAVEGEVVLDQAGDGFINIGKVTLCTFRTFLEHIALYMSILMKLFDPSPCFRKHRHTCPLSLVSILCANTVCMASSPAWKASRSCPRLTTTLTVC